MFHVRLVDVLGSRRSCEEARPRPALRENFPPWGVRDADSSLRSSPVPSPQLLRARLVIGDVDTVSKIDDRLWVTGIRDGTEGRVSWVC